MKKIIKQLIVSVFLVLGMGTTFIAAPAAFAASPLTQACDGQEAAICDDNTDINSVIGIVVNTLLYLIGAVAVIMIIVGGFKYTTSGGDSGSVASAKNTILYSVIGLLVALFAYAIVNWVLDIF